MDKWQYGKDYITLDFTGLGEIAQKLGFKKNTGLNLRTLNENILTTIAEKRNYIMIPGQSYSIILSEILKYLGIVDYEIVEDYNMRNIGKLKNKGVIYVGSINDFGDFNINSIDGYFNSTRHGLLNRHSFVGRYNKPYVLFYNKEIPTKIIDLVRGIFFQRVNSQLLLENNI